MGRPKKWEGTKRKRAETVILGRLAAGRQSLKTICQPKHMPSHVTVFEWLGEGGDFANSYARAREVQADVLAEEIIDIADDGSRDMVKRTRSDGSEYEAVDHDHIQRSKLRVDARKWMAAKLQPTKYGEKQTVEVDTKTPVVMAWRPPPDGEKEKSE